VVVQGKVKFFDDGRGFGFISRDSGEDLFVHVSNLRPGGPTALVEGQAVEFEIGPGRTDTAGSRHGRRRVPSLRPMAAPSKLGPPSAHAAFRYNRTSACSGKLSRQSGLSNSAAIVLALSRRTA
jgi:CspA family cold shock protein